MWNSGRCRRLTSVVLRALVGRADLAAPEAVRLGPHDRLGPGRRPGRVLDGRWRVVRDRPERPGVTKERPEGMPVLTEIGDVEDVGGRHRGPGGRGGRAGGDHGSRVAVPGDVAEVVGGGARVEADGDRPHRRDGRPGDEQLGTVGQHQGDAISGGRPRAPPGRPRTPARQRRTRPGSTSAPGRRPEPR